jgi:hypothetical protein
MGCAISTVLALLAPAGPKVNLFDIARQMEAVHHSQYVTRFDTERVENECGAKVSA